MHTLTMTDVARLLDYVDPSDPHAPISRLRGSNFYAVRSWELIVDAATRTDEFSSNLTATMVLAGDEITEFPIAELGSSIHALATADKETHRRHRTLVLPSLTPKKLRSWTPFVSETLDQLWSEGLNAGRIDWMSAIAERLPAAVIAELIGFPQEDKDQLMSWVLASTAMLDGLVDRKTLARSITASSELMTYLEAALARARQDPSDGVLSDLASLIEQGELDSETAVQILIQLLAAGTESTAAHLGSLAYLLGEHPEHIEALRKDPEIRPRFIEEALRFEAPFRGHYRHVVRDTRLGGTPLPAGSHLFLMWGAANRDTNEFTRPGSFEPHRSESSHLSFGKGIHFCVGAALARIEAKAALDLLLSQPSTLHIHSQDAQWTPSVLVRRIDELAITV